MIGIARPIKDGVDYFPVDTDFFQDEKVRLLKAEFGAKGLVILLALLCDIYRGNGYYKVWDKDACLLMADAVGCGAGPETITQVVHGCLRRSIFDNGVFQMSGILTSAGIQRRYIRAVSAREEIILIREYWLLHEDEKKDVPASVLPKLVFKTVSLKKTPESLEKTPVSLQNNPQRRGKENRGKESRGVPSPPAKESLYALYGKPLVDVYLAKAARYRRGEQAILLAAAEWLAKDAEEGRAKRPGAPPVENSSLDLDEYEKRVKEYVPVFEKKEQKA